MTTPEPFTVHTIAAPLRVAWLGLVVESRRWGVFVHPIGWARERRAAELRALAWVDAQRERRRELELRYRRKGNR